MRTVGTGHVFTVTSYPLMISGFKVCDGLDSQSCGEAIDLGSTHRLDAWGEEATRDSGEAAVKHGTT